jgi:hypothetical protein
MHHLLRLRLLLQLRIRTKQLSNSSRVSTTPEDNAMKWLSNNELIKVIFIFQDDEMAALNYVTIAIAITGGSNESLTREWVRSLLAQRGLGADP